MGFCVAVNCGNNRGMWYERRSSDSVLGYFISKITSQQHKILFKKSKFYHFLWLASKNSKNHFFTQKSVKHQILRNRIKSKILIWSFYLT